MTQQLLNDDTLNDDQISNDPISDDQISDDYIDGLLNDDEEISDEEMITELDISHLVIEDDTPVDNFQSEVQQRLLVEPLYSAKALPPPFLAAANVGLFYKLKGGNTIVPDVMLSLGVQRAEDFSERRDRSYFVWEFGKVPEVCIEIVSNQEGDELAVSKKSQQKGKTTSKKDLYAQIGVAYYVVFDPLQQLQDEREMNGALLRVWTISPVGYVELSSTQGVSRVGESIWLEGIGLGLTLWQGQFEEAVTRLWLRWCDRDGRVIATGAEGQQMERQRADSEQQRANRLAERLRAMGINPDDI
jgi:Uma2 family endonuclease